MECKCVESERDGNLQSERFIAQGPNRQKMESKEIKNSIKIEFFEKISIDPFLIQMNLLIFREVSGLHLRTL